MMVMRMVMMMMMVVMRMVMMMVMIVRIMVMVIVMMLVMVVMMDDNNDDVFRNDIAMAITKYDQFDFLIDIVPRDDIKPSTARKEDSSVRMAPDQVSNCKIIL